MDVSIIIVNYNTLNFVRNCIESIINKTKDIDYEIIIVDNASTDGSKEYFIEDFRVKYIYSEKNLGFGLANNEGIKVATGRNIFLLNPDTLLLNNAIKILSNFLDENPQIGCCGGNLYNNDMQPIHSYSMMLPSYIWEINLLCGGIIEKMIWGKNAQFNYTGQPRKVGYICGADMMLKFDTLKQVGYFSDKFFLYYEDTELSYRIKQAGYEIVSLPDAKIQHLVGKSLGGKDFNKTRIQFVEDGLTSFYSLHSHGISNKLLKYLRLLRLNIKYMIYRNKYSCELYKKCKAIINKQNSNV